MTSQASTLDGNYNPIASPLPVSAVAVTGDSGNVANATATATLAAAAGVTNWLTGFIVTASGATSAGVVTGTITGLKGGTLHFTYTAPAGVAVAATPLVIDFAYPMPASAKNQAVAVVLPALGSGNTNATVIAKGFQL